MPLDIASFFNFSSVTTFTGAEAVIASFLIGLIFAGIIKHLFRLGLLIGLLVAVLVVLGVVSINLGGGASGISLQSVYALATSIWGFLSQLATAVSLVFEKGGIDAGLAGIFGFVLGWVGLGFVPLRRKD